MSAALQIDEAVLRKLDAVAEARQTSREALVEEAIGLLLDQEDGFVEDIRAGLAEAERGEFASDADIARVLSKYRRG